MLESFQVAFNAVMPLLLLLGIGWAAVRSGIRRVLIPKENEEDLRDVPEEVKDKLTIETVETVEEVLGKTGVL